MNVGEHAEAAKSMSRVACWVFRVQHAAVMQREEEEGCRNAFHACVQD